MLSFLERHIWHQRRVLEGICGNHVSGTIAILGRLQYWKIDILENTQLIFYMEYWFMSPIHLSHIKKCLTLFESL